MVLKKNNYKRYLLLSIFITLVLELAIIIQYSLPRLSLITFGLTVLVSVMVYTKKSQMHFATWWLYIYLICSFLIVACFKYIPYKFGLGSDSISNRDFLALAKVSINVMFVFFCSVFIFNNTQNRRKCVVTTDIIPYINENALFIIAYILTLISFVLGLGRMGSEEHELPFHLTGIIHFLRTNIVPICALFVYARNKKEGKSNSRFIIWFFVWTLLEMFVRMSKGFLLRSFFPIIFFEFICGESNYKRILRRFSPMVIVFFLMYPVIESMRHMDSFNAAVNDAYSSQEDDGESGTYTNPSARDFLVRPFNRTFYSGYLFVKDQSYVDDNSLFDFSKMPVILAMQGSARYQTRIIDGYPEGLAHSSGTTSLVDAFLVGGYGLMYIQLVILTLLAVFIDKIVKSRYNNVLSAILVLFFWDLVPRESFSGFVAPMYIRSVFMYLLIIFITWRIIEKKKDSA